MNKPIPWIVVLYGIVAILLSALVVSNIFWYIKIYDVADRNFYIQNRLDAECGAVEQALLLIRMKAKEIRLEDLTGLLDGEKHAEKNEDFIKIRSTYFTFEFRKNGELLKVERSGFIGCN